MQNLSFAIYLFYTAAITHLFAACESDEMTVEPDVSKNALSVQGSAGPPAAERAVIGDDGPSLPVTMRWVEMKPRATVETDALYLEIENRSVSDFMLRARLICHGLMQMKSIDVEGLYLPTGETAMLHVPARDVPIQLTSGAAQARMEILLNEIEDGTEDTRQVRYLTPAINYRHGPRYQGLSIFDETALMQQHGGILVGDPTGAKSPQEIVGRVLEPDKRFRNVLLSDETFEHSGGRVLGMVIGSEEPGEATNPKENEIMGEPEPSEENKEVL
jgi:hypothetical protein